MDKEAIKEYLKKNLDIDISIEASNRMIMNDDDKTVTVTLSLEGEEIGKATADVIIPDK